MSGIRGSRGRGGSIIAGRHVAVSIGRVRAGATTSVTREGSRRLVVKRRRADATAEKVGRVYSFGV